MKVGIPYAPVNPDRTRTCPVCQECISETFDAHGELKTNNYGEHYVATHEEPQDG